MYLQPSILVEESQSLPIRSKANERFLGHSIRYLDLFLEILCHMAKECENIGPMLPLKGIYIYITDPLILSSCLRAIDSETVRPRRLRIGMWPLPMGAGDLGRMRSASTASEAVGGCSTFWSKPHQP